MMKQADLLKADIARIDRVIGKIDPDLVEKYPGLALSVQSMRYLREDFLRQLTELSDNEGNEHDVVS